MRHKVEDMMIDLGASGAQRAVRNHSWRLLRHGQIVRMSFLEEDMAVEVEGVMEVGEDMEMQVLPHPQRERVE